MVVKGVADDWFTGEEPEEALGDATGVNDRVGLVVCVNDFVVGVLWHGAIELDEAVASGVGAVSSANNSGAGSEVNILKGVGDSEVTIRLEVGVLSLDASGIVRLEELAQNVLLFVPDAHVGSSVEVLEGCGLVAGGVAESFSVEVHG